MKKYHGIDWLRALACIGIMAMHIRANNAYEIGGFVYERVIPSFTEFVLLFMMISAFGLCCGYYDKVLSGTIDWVCFYKSRYLKILPFFALLIFADLAVSFSLPSVYEGLIELTLLHGFLPKTLSVIGVGWYLGTLFVFYLLFPFFCVLLRDKRWAWVGFLLSILVHYVVKTHFGLSRPNILFSFCYFFAGGLLFLYREILEKGKWYGYLPVLVLALGLYYFVSANLFTQLFVAGALLCFGISLPRAPGKLVSFFSGISMEFYLSHMLVFRVVERLGWNRALGTGWLQYFVTFALVLLGTAAFSAGGKWAIKTCGGFFKKKKEERPPKQAEKELAR